MQLYFSIGLIFIVLDLNFISIPRLKNIYSTSANAVHLANKACLDIPTSLKQNLLLSSHPSTDSHLTFGVRIEFP